MKVYHYEERETSWNRWHILAAITWTFAFIGTIGWLMTSTFKLVSVGDINALIHACASIAFFTGLLRINSLLREHCFFQEIYDDFGKNHDSAYHYENSASFKDDQAGQLMALIENPNITPCSRQEKRRELKSLILGQRLSPESLQQVKKRHGYLL